MSPLLDTNSPCKAAFEHCDKILEKKEPNEGKAYCGLQFQRFQSIVGCLYCFDPKVRQNIKAVGTCGQEAGTVRGIGDKNYLKLLTFSTKPDLLIDHSAM
jgi:hypothetical protein